MDLDVKLYLYRARAKTGREAGSWGLCEEGELRVYSEDYYEVVAIKTIQPVKVTINVEDIV